MEIKGEIFFCAMVASLVVGSLAMTIPADTKNVASNDFKVMVSIEGSFKFNKSSINTNMDYLPLDLLGVSYIELGHYDEITIETSGLDLMVDYYLRHDGYANDFVSLIQVELKQPIGGQTVCYIYDTFIESDPIQHYSCQVEKSYDCLTDRQSGEVVLGSLVLNSFEFEVEGNPESLKKGEFSSPAYPCY